MNQTNGQLYIDTFIDWYKSKITYNELQQATQIISPYLNHINDRIAIYVQMLDNGHIRLSDDGQTLNELDMAGLDINTPTRKKILDEILINFGVQLNDTELTVTTPNIKAFPQQKHNLLEAIRHIYDLMFTQTSHTISLFKEEVLNFFYEHNFGGSISPQFQGVSSITHYIDYNLGATKNRPNILMKFQNNPDYSSVTDQVFVANDLEQNSQLKQHGFKYVMITGKPMKPDSKAARAAQHANISVIYHKDKSQLLSLKNNKLS